MIAESYIQDLLSKADIISIIDSQVKLKRQGKNYSACCPFHDEKTPSFTANHDKQMFYCFGCGAGGDAIKFVMDYQRLDFPSAVGWIANRIGMPLNDAELPVAKPALRRDIKDQYEEDKIFLAIYEAANGRGETISHSDYQRYKLATNRIAGIESRFINVS